MATNQIVIKRLNKCLDRIESNQTAILGLLRDLAAGQGEPVVLTEVEMPHDIDPGIVRQVVRTPSGEPDIVIGDNIPKTAKAKPKSKRKAKAVQ